MSAFPSDLVNCPGCSTSFQGSSQKSLVCALCKQEYPFLQSIPWLFPVPQYAFGFWRDNLKLHLQQVERDVLSLETSLNHPELLASQKTRLKKWIEAKKEFSRSLELVLNPLVSASNAPMELGVALRDAIPMTQRLGSYLENIYRDWSWGDENGENRESLEILLSLVTPERSFEKFLVLGAGACRLAYDFHLEKKNQQTVASDINPLYLLLAREMIQGNKKLLYEFPLAPKDGASFYVQRDLKAPKALKNGFDFVFADGMNPPFPGGSFDGLLTPWFIDIVPQDPKMLFRRLNHVLKRGGVWLNFGSCFFNHPDFSRRYSKEEIIEIVEQSGFKILKSMTKKIPYLQNPSSAHGRTEETFSFSAEKTKDIEQPPRYQYLPDWLLDSKKVIPQNAVFSQFAAVHGIYHQIASAIDGNTSLEMLGKNLGPRFGLTPEDAAQSFGRFLTKIYETGTLFQI